MTTEQERLDPTFNLEYRSALFAMEKHRGMKRDDGKDYFEAHLKQVVATLKTVTEDREVLAAGYLHDTLEDTQTTYDELVQNFGKRVADLVNEVTHEGKADAKGYYFPRLTTKEGIMLKFADRLSNLSQMEAWAMDRQQHYLKKSKFWKSE